RKLGDPDPTASIPAIRASAARKDLRAVDQLVEDLDHDDPAVRFYAIRALREITGQTFNYRYFEDELERKPAVEAWRSWLKNHRATAGATTLPRS
ncbi:MAG: HEAT repeat domain-containing protein, partial [Phycisphaerae bacterium]|nr:HEAT repeat domain-containing protein [Phycisphaerae bacterium]